MCVLIFQFHHERIAIIFQTTEWWFNFFPWQWQNDKIAKFSFYLSKQNQMPACFLISRQTIKDLSQRLNVTSGSEKDFQIRIRNS